MSFLVRRYLLFIAETDIPSINAESLSLINDSSIVKVFSGSISSLASNSLYDSPFVDDFFTALSAGVSTCTADKSVVSLSSQFSDNATMFFMDTQCPVVVFPVVCVVMASSQSSLL